MLREGWNFHVDIAIQLESDANYYFRGFDRPVDKIYDADAIELGRFVEVMIILLREKTNFNNEHDEIDECVTDCAPYLGKSGNSIEPEIANELYVRFTNLFH